MVFIQDLLELKNRNLFLVKAGKKFPMGLQYYVADDIFFFEVDENINNLSMLDDLRTALEKEAEDKCWAEDVYIAPMEHISSCELRFPRNFSNVTDRSDFNNNYVVTHIDTTLDDIIIHLA